MTAKRTPYNSLVNAGFTPIGAGDVEGSTWHFWVLEEFPAHAVMIQRFKRARLELVTYGWAQPDSDRHEGFFVVFRM